MLNQIRKKVGSITSPELAGEILILQYGAGKSLQTLTSGNNNKRDIYSSWRNMSSKLINLEKRLAVVDYGQYTKARESLVALAELQDEQELVRLLQALIDAC